MFDLAERVELDRSPLTDIKELGECDIGLIEGRVCNAENVHVLMEFRARCKTLIAIGACALNGGIPAMRNQFALRDCLEESYLRGVGLVDPQIPNDPEIPLLLARASGARGGQNRLLSTWLPALGGHHLDFRQSIVVRSAGRTVLYPIHYD